MRGRGKLIILVVLLLVAGVVGVVLLGPTLLGGVSGGGASGGKKVTPSASPTPTQIPTVDILVVVQPIPLGAIVESAYLSTIAFPRESLVEGMYMTDVEDAVGMRARFDLEPGVILSKHYLADQADQVSNPGSEASFLIKPGMVAVSIPITRLSSVSFAPQRGDHVNVIVTLLLVELDPDFQTITPSYTAGVLAPGPSILLGSQDSSSFNTNELQRNLTAQIAGGGQASRQGRSETDPFLEQSFYLVPSENQRPRLVSQTLIQDVMVLQVGTFEQVSGKALTKPEMETTPDLTRTAPPTATPSPTRSPTVGPAVTAVPPKPPDIITLVVSPQDAVTLNYLIYAGAELTLALRPVGDSTPVQTQAVTLDFLLNNYAISRPVKLDIGIEPRLDELVAPSLPNDIIPTPEK